MTYYCLPPDRRRTYMRRRNKTDTPPGLMKDMKDGPDSDRMNRIFLEGMNMDSLNEFE